MGEGGGIGESGITLFRLLAGGEGFWCDSLPSSLPILYQQDPRNTALPGRVLSVFQPPRREVSARSLEHNLRATCLESAVFFSMDCFVLPGMVLANSCAMKEVTHGLALSWKLPRVF